MQIKVEKEKVKVQKNIIDKVHEMNEKLINDQENWLTERENYGKIVTKQEEIIKNLEKENNLLKQATEEQI